MKNNNCNKILLTLLVLFVSGCASSIWKPNESVTADNVSVNSSYLKQDNLTTTIVNADLVSSELKNGEFTRLNNSGVEEGIKLEIDLSNKFDSESVYQFAVNELPLNDLLHYVLGDLLKVSYLIEPSVKSNVTPVTLDLKEKVSAKRLFQLLQQILNQNNTTIALDNDIFFVHPLIDNGTKDNIAFGYGASEENVPSVSSDIIQMVPLVYGTSGSLRGVIASLVNVKISMDSAQGLAILQGKRDQIIRALSLIAIFDSERLKNKAVAMLSFNYIDSQTFIEKITELLALEGIEASRSVANSVVIKFVPIEHLGKVVVFATSEKILDRVEYWTKQLDQPATGSEQSFYTYHPQYARATDLGESLAPLISASNSFDGQANDNRLQRSSINNQQITNSNSQSSTQTIEGDNLRLVVDERSNSLIFYSTGKFYQELLPIVRNLDVMPKQVMLEVVIAEVKLTGSFAKGVNFAIQNGPTGTKTENFNYASKEGFSYSVVGLNGNVNINLNQTDGLINVLSRPTILVRDGVSASISVGDDIPTVGSTTSDPINGERQTTTIQYRKTGVDLSVTPTINAQGTVIMTIVQNISNISPDGLSVGGSPSVFERKISTEVVAADGQSVMLGGLISENKSSNASSVPVLGSIPVIGHLFRNDSESRDKTELVVLVTPRIVSNPQEWQRIQQSFMKGLENIKF
ncbi:secretin N-terminal domain-containing protein [Thalassotalea sp. SU-HH00458]|uniref:secretin N-terminal domain-containing protein n=1 Tax=Thalassotalea sp. SU-HH00458 TaxID=3127657 RepID=UPI0031039C26